jgi:hypothetical protein
MTALLRLHRQHDTRCSVLDSTLHSKSTRSLPFQRTAYEPQIVVLHRLLWLVTRLVHHPGSSEQPELSLLMKVRQVNQTAVS